MTPSCMHHYDMLNKSYLFFWGDHAIGQMHRKYWSIEPEKMCFAIEVYNLPNS